ncbi:MAG: LytTR family DNA-binding domain-containing protein [Bacteroidia bacterium]|nr:LytTR family DNA-binding domain-containing protein [Bacteroidia bacterium]
MNCLIVDDEHLARKLLAAYIGKIPELQLAGECENAVQALSFLQKEKIDLMFLDIQMPDLTGVELLKTLKYKPLVVFVTAYAEYALEGYELDVIDYMLKPVAFERFVQAINKASEQRRLRSQPEAEKQIEIVPGKDYFFVKVDYKLVKVRYDEILFVEGMREYVNIQTAQRRHIVYHSMKNMESLLPEGKFARIHKSYIVAMDKIRSLYGNVVEIGDKEIPIGKSYKDDFLKKIETI